MASSCYRIMVILLLCVASQFVVVDLQHANNNGEGEGACPRIDATNIRCIAGMGHMCFTDDNCGGDTKCCFNGCVFACTQPEVGPALHPCMDIGQQSTAVTGTTSPNGCCECVDGVWLCVTPECSNNNVQLVPQDCTSGNMVTRSGTYDQSGCKLYVCFNGIEMDIDLDCPTPEAPPQEALGCMNSNGTLQYHGSVNVGQRNANSDTCLTCLCFDGRWICLAGIPCTAEQSFPNFNACMDDVTGVLVPTGAPGIVRNCRALLCFNGVWFNQPLLACEEGNTNYIGDSEGVCPRIDATNIRCIAGSEHKCSTDDNCDGDTKCCFNGCVLACTRPEVGPALHPCMVIGQQTMVETGTSSPNGCCECVDGVWLCVNPECNNNTFQFVPRDCISGNMLIRSGTYAQRGCKLYVCFNGIEMDVDLECPTPEAPPQEALGCMNSNGNLQYHGSVNVGQRNANSDTCLTCLCFDGRWICLAGIPCTAEQPVPTFNACMDDVRGVPVPTGAPGIVRNCRALLCFNGVWFDQPLKACEGENINPLECYRCENCVAGKNMSFLQDVDVCSNPLVGDDEARCYKNIKEDGSIHRGCTTVSNCLIEEKAGLGKCDEENNTGCYVCCANEKCNYASSLTSSIAVCFASILVYVFYK